VLKELGAHPDSGAPIELLEGRYGPYVTDGSVNASIPKTSDPDSVTLDDAVQMLAEAATRKKKGRRGKKRSKRSRG
jgi:DNA topoisomerase-1